MPLRLTGKKLGVKKITPFDLHVLGAPPAFVLSQDQTLYKWYLITYKVLNRCIHSARNRLRPCELLCLELFYVIFHHEKRFLTSFRYCSIFKVLCCLVAKQLMYNTTLFPKCQRLFSLFGRFRQNVHFPRRSSRFCSPFPTKRPSVSPKKGVLCGRAAGWQQKRPLPQGAGVLML